MAMQGGTGTPDKGSFSCTYLRSGQGPFPGVGSGASPLWVEVDLNTANLSIERDIIALVTYNPPPPRTNLTQLLDRCARSLVCTSAKYCLACSRVLMDSTRCKIWVR
jgi:hypothetical protein